MNDPLHVILRQYLGALAQIEAIESFRESESARISRILPTTQAKLDELSQMLDDVKERKAPWEAQRDYLLQALNIWRANPATNLMVWKLENPKP